MWWCRPSQSQYVVISAYVNYTLPTGEKVLSLEGGREAQ